MPTDTTTTTVPASLRNWDEMNRLLQIRQREANAARVPGAPELESASSAAIASLLTPGFQFADTDRRAAELGASRGVGGSAAGIAVGYRMTDDERLKRIALGQEMLTAAVGRNPTVGISASDVADTRLSPYQQQLLALQNRNQRLDENRFNLDRTLQSYMGRPTTSTGNPSPTMINIAGSGWPAQWVNWLPGTTL